MVARGSLSSADVACDVFTVATAMVASVSEAANLSISERRLVGALSQAGFRADKALGLVLTSLAPLGGTLEAVEIWANKLNQHFQKPI